MKVPAPLLSARPCWGVTPETRRQWLSWVSYGPFAGRR